jgi:Flp pilus assembly protein TadB
MKTTTTFSGMLDEIRYAFRQLMRVGAEAGAIIAALPWPALLAAAVVLAFVLTILPLVIMLFLAFLLLKLVVNSMASRQQRPGD